MSRPDRTGGRLRTADVFWDRQWRSQEGRAPWLGPDPWVQGTTELLLAENVLDTLDLGCGVGRHTTLMARNGFNSHGTDKSLTAARESQQRAQEHGLRVPTTVSDMTALPYQNHSFDFVLAFNVVYHADESGLAQVLGEVRRVLRPGCRYHATMLSKRNHEYGRGVEVASNTFCQPDALDDKVHPHLYVDASDLARLHQNFEILNVFESRQQTPGSYHWYLESVVR